VAEQAHPPREHLRRGNQLAAFRRDPHLLGIEAGVAFERAPEQSPAAPLIGQLEPVEQLEPGRGLVAPQGA